MVSIRDYLFFNYLIFLTDTTQILVLPLAKALNTGVKLTSYTRSHSPMLYNSNPLFYINDSWTDDRVSF